GKNHREAAEQLGWPIGTVSGRLSRAKGMLARGVARRGGAPPAGWRAGGVRPEAGAGPRAPPPVLFPASGARRVFAGREGRGGAAAGVLPAEVGALTQGVLKAMLLGKLNGMGIALLAMALVGTGLVWIASRGSAAGQEPANTRSATGARNPAQRDEERLQGVW